MTNAEIDRRLALAIGYPAGRVRVVDCPFGGDVVEVLNYAFLPGDPAPFTSWREFDHANPAVIWPIAELFDAWPNSANANLWLSAQQIIDYEAGHINAAAVSALAVIRHFESNA